MIPKFNEVMLPLLKLCADGEIHSNTEVLEKMCEQFKLSSMEAEERLPSGTQTVIYNRTQWAITYLRKAKLIENVKRSEFKITSRGQDVLKEKLAEISVKYLKRFDEFKSFQEVDKSADYTENTFTEQTPTDVLTNAYKQINSSLKSEIIERLLKVHPFKFEEIVVKVLINLGYGGSFEEAGKAFKKSGDEGIDGIISEDRLGLDMIYVQAKRYALENKIGRPLIQEFCGALMGKKAKKGIFITTSSYTREAEEYVKNIDTKVILINGEQLAQYMIETNSGVEIDFTYYIKRINMDFFE